MKTVTAWLIFCQKFLIIITFTRFNYSWTW